MSSPRRALLLLVVADAAALHGTSLRVRDTTLRAQKDRLDYDHLYHIGSPVDVFKHCVLTALLRRCTAKASPLTYAETHAGRGLYAFDSEEASMLSEFVDGYHKLRVHEGREKLHADIAAYLAAQRPDYYVGSAALAALALREGDRGIFFERDSECAAALTDALTRFGADFTVEARDGYAGTRQLRVSTRGLVFVDPPYQSGSDTDLIAALCGHLKQYWRAARIAVWYPRGDGGDARTERLRHEVLAATGEFDVLDAHLTVPGDASTRLRSSGMLLVQPPYGFDDELAVLLPELAELLAPGGRWGVEWLRRG